MLGRKKAENESFGAVFAAEVLEALRGEVLLIREEKQVFLACVWLFGRSSILENILVAARLALFGFQRAPEATILIEIV